MNGRAQWFKAYHQPSHNVVLWGRTLKGLLAEMATHIRPDDWPDFTVGSGRNEPSAYRVVLKGDALVEKLRAVSLSAVPGTETEPASERNEL